MGFIALKCPQCGANIELDDAREFGFCPYCGTKAMQELQNIHLSGSVIVDRSNDVANLLIRAQALMVQGRRKDAIRVYERILEIDPANDDAMDSLHAVEHIISSPNVLVKHVGGPSAKGSKINYALDDKKIGKFNYESSTQITVPVGEHTLTFWHTMCGEKDVDINIRDCYTKIRITLQTKWFGFIAATVEQDLT